MVRERIPGKEPEHRRGPLQEADEQIPEPRRRLEAAEGREPHLPVEPGLVRLDEPGAPHHAARLVPGLVRAPGGPVVAALEDDLLATGRHHPEEAVAVGAPERLHQPERRGERRRKADPRHDRAHERDDAEAEQHEARGGGDGSGSTAHLGFLGTRRDGVGRPHREDPPPAVVIHERQRQRDGEQIEEGVVAGGEDEQLQPHDARQRDAAGTSAEEDERWNGDFEQKHHHHRQALHALGLEVGVPRRPGGKGLGPVVVVQRGQVPPGRIAAGELHDARLEGQPEEEKPEQRQAQGRNPRLLPASGPRASRREQHGDQPGLEQQHVPLEGEEVQAHADKGEVEQPGEESAHPRPDVEHQEQRGERPRRRAKVERARPRPEPEDGREQVVPLGAGLGPDRVEEPLRGEDPLGPDQALELHPEGDEGDEVDEPQRTQADPSRERVGSPAGHPGEPGERRRDPLERWRGGLSGRKFGTVLGRHAWTFSRAGTPGDRLGSYRGRRGNPTLESPEEPMTHVATILAALAAAAPAARRPAVVPPVRSDTVRYAVTISGNRAGSEVHIREADGSLRALFEFNDRGRGPKVDSRITLDAGGLPSSVAITGNDYLKVPVDERFTLAGGTATWTSSAEQGSKAVTRPAFYLPLNAPPGMLAILAGALLRTQERRLDLLPAGEARIELAGGTVVRRGSESRPVTAYAITGLDYTPSYLWLDEDRTLFGVASGWSSVVREGGEAEITALSAVQDSLARVRERADARRLGVRPTGPVAFTGAPLFDAPAATLVPGTPVVVEGNRATAVGPDDQVSIPAGARRIDARGKTLLPGLWDMHAHMSAVDGPLDIAAGVTSIRDMANDADFLAAKQKQWDEGTAIGPRVVKAGFIDGRGPFQGPSKALVSTV